MTVIRTSRSALDKGLADLALTLLLLSGDSDAAHDVHDTAEGEEQETPSRRVFLVTDVSRLTASEQANWLSAADQYVVLGGKNRVALKKGPIDDLCKQDGTASIRQIIRAFSQGDQA